MSQKQEIKIICGYCQNIKDTTNRELSAYFGRFYSWQCSKCSKKYSIEITKELLMLKGIRMKTDKKEDKTLVLTERELVNRLAKVAIIGSDDTPPQVFDLVVGENIIGRSTGHFTTSDAKMSRTHCKITVDKKGEGFKYYLEDLKSTNATYLDERKLDEFEIVGLAINQRFRIGRTNFHLIID